MKDWKITKDEHGYTLYHIHHGAIWYKDILCTVQRGRWMCMHCEEEAPDVMQDAANLAKCQIYRAFPHPKEHVIEELENSNN